MLNTTMVLFIILNTNLPEPNSLQIKHKKLLELLTHQNDPLSL